MAKTDTERQRKRRQWLRDPSNREKYTKYLENDRKRKKVAKLFMSKEERHKLKRREADASRRYRAKKEQGTSSTGPSFTPQSLGRAKRRVMKHLPKSPRTKKAVVRKLTKEILNIDLEHEHHNRPSRAISETLKEKVNAIYHREARMMPGKADTVSVKKSSVRRNI